jgi:tRNA1Val (adenine37-N6)-methyltransferase
MKSSTLKTKRFKFKQFSIDGGQAGMPVSTDGVLLGAWAFTHHPKTILDIGTGTGLLALMCAQRFSDAQITAIDIDDFAFEAAQHNSNASSWGQRIHVLQGDILHTSLTPSFDAIICNPPYFNSGELSHDPQRATARHTNQLAHHTLLVRAKSLLNDEGQACFILPVYEGGQFIEQALTLGWQLKLRCTVQPTVHKPAHRLLIELSLTSVNPIDSQLIIHSSNGYSEAFIVLTQDFYLKM